MKLNDVHLKIRPPKNKEEEENYKRARQKHMDQLATKLRMVQELGQSEGWKFFLSELNHERIRLLTLVEKAIDPTPLAKFTGSLLAVEGFIRWSNDVAAELEAAAKDMAQDEED